MKTKLKIPVSERALLARVNRKLAHEEEQLRRARGFPAQVELGDYYAVNIRGNYITAQRVDLESWAKELGVLKPYEKLAES